MKLSLFVFGLVCLGVVSCGSNNCPVGYYSNGSACVASTSSYGYSSGYPSTAYQTGYNSGYGYSGYPSSGYSNSGYGYGY